MQKGSVFVRTTIDYEPAPDIMELAEKIIMRKSDIKWILDDDYFHLIGFVRSHISKTNSPDVPADCRKVPNPFRAFVPYDIIITVYEPCANLLSENQFKILLYHELKHIGTTQEQNLKVNDHDTKDFYVILKNYGIDWQRYDSQVPDILKE